MYNHDETNSISDDDTDVMCDIESINSDTSVIRLSKEQAIQMKKLSDPDFHAVKRQIGNKTKTIEMYSTNTTPGRRIRDPVSGVRFNERVGTKAEKQFFKIHITSFGDGTEPIILFYSSPEAYERHQRTKMNNAVKLAWHNSRRNISTL